MIERFPWALYSSKLVKSIVRPAHYGVLSKDERRLVVGKEGGEGNWVQFCMLVNEENGVIGEAKFQAYGETLLIGAAEIICELVIEKNYAQAKRISAELVEKQVKGFPSEGASYIHLALDALDLALEQCEGLPMPEEFLVTPVDLSELKGGDYPNWAALTHTERLGYIQEIIAHEIAPYVQLDGGNVIIKELKNDLAVVIKYEGNCTTWISSTGSTLTAIQQILRAKVHPQMDVIADF